MEEVRLRQTAARRPGQGGARELPSQPLKASHGARARPGVHRTLRGPHSSAGTQCGPRRAPAAPLSTCSAGSPGHAPHASSPPRSHLAHALLCVFLLPASSSLRPLMTPEGRVRLLSDLVFRTEGPPGRSRKAPEAAAGRVHLRKLEPPPFRSSGRSLRQSGPPLLRLRTLEKAPPDLSRHFLRRGAALHCGSRVTPGSSGFQGQ